MNLLIIFAIMTVTAVVTIVIPLPGFSFYVPLFSTFMTTQQAITFATVFFWLTYFAMAYAFRKFVRKDMVKALIPGSIIGSVVGGLFTSSLNELLLTWLLLGFVLYYFLVKLRFVLSGAKKPKKSKHSRHGAMFVGAVAGLMQGSGLGGGAIRQGYLYAKHLTLEESRGTTAYVGIVVLGMSLLTRALNGTFATNDWWLYLPLIPIAFMAAFLGRYITMKIKPRAQEVIIVSLMFIAVVLVIKKLSELMS